MSPHAIGAVVRAHKNSNRLGNYYNATVVAAHRLPYNPGSNVFFAEKNLVAVTILRALTLDQLPRPRYNYDLRYDDGELEEGVGSERIRVAE